MKAFGVEGFGCEGPWCRALIGCIEIQGRGPGGQLVLILL